MDRSYKIYKSYHTSHHNTTKTHLQISTPPSSVQQRTDIHNLPPNHMESQPSKLQASSNAPTLTTSPANHKESQPFLPAIQRSADGSANSRQTTLSLTKGPHSVRFAAEVRVLWSESWSILASEVVHGEVPGGHKPQGKAHLSEPGTHQRTWRVMGRPLRETPQTLSMTRRNDGTRTSAANLTRPSASSCPHQTPVL